MDIADKNASIRSLSRGIAVLQAINRGGSLSMMQISKGAGIPYPTACRIVQTLIDEELIEREPSQKRYRPTALVQTLSHGFQGHAELVRAARQHIVTLTRDVGWPISLASHVGHSMVIRDSTHSLTALTFSTYFPGYAMSIIECASGLVYLAHLPESDRTSLLDSLKVLANRDALAVIRSLRDPDYIAGIQRDGYATRLFNQFTRNPGKTSSIAVPILVGDQPIGTLTIAFFASAMRMAEAVERFVGPLQQAAAAIAFDLHPAV